MSVSFFGDPESLIYPSIYSWKLHLTAPRIYCRQSAFDIQHRLPTLRVAPVGADVAYLEQVAILYDDQRDSVHYWRKLCTR